MTNPLTYAQTLVSDYERRYLSGKKLNAIDYANMQSLGNPTRVKMRQMYGLSDEQVDTMIQAGSQTLNAGGKLDFGSADALNAAGLNTDKLGLQAASFSTITGDRDAQFALTQEDAMVGRLEIEKQLQETLGNLEERFGGLIGVLGQFERIIQTIGMSMMMLGGLGSLGGGGGLLGGLGRGGLGRAGAGAAGVAGQAVGSAGMFGSAPPGVIGSSPTVARAGGIRGALGSAATRLTSTTGMIGVGLGVGGMMMASGADSGADVAISGLMTGAGVALATGNVPLAVGAGAAAAVYAAANYFDSESDKDAEDEYFRTLHLSEDELIASFDAYKKVSGYGENAELLDTTAGPKERGRFDVFSRRRGALAAAAIAEGESINLFDDLYKENEDTNAKQLGELFSFFKSDKVDDDKELLYKMIEAKKYFEYMRSKPDGMRIYQKYFGDAKPLDMMPITTPEAKSLIPSQGQVNDERFAQSSQAPEGDGSFSLSDDSLGLLSGLPMHRTGDPGDGNYGNIEGLDARMRDRIIKLIDAGRAAGVNLSVQTGVRSPARQEAMFRERHVVDPNGSIEWNGQRWRHVRGAAAAPPGRCLDGETPVLTRRGLVPIKDMVVGDEVWTHKNRWRSVTAHVAFVKDVVELHIDGHDSIVCTPDHRWFYVNFWNDLEVVEALELEGHCLIAMSEDEQQRYEVLAVTALDEQRLVFDITVDDDESFYADGLLSHNSMHEIGLAVDMGPDSRAINWAMNNAARFGLKHFANVNNEPWHLQPVELPNSRREFEQGGGTSSAAPGAAPSTAPGAPAGSPAPLPMAMSQPQGAMAKGMSGTGFDLKQAMASVRAPGGLAAPTPIAAPGAAGAAGAAGAIGPNGETLPPTIGDFTPPDQLAAFSSPDLATRGGAVAKALYAAGFRGQDLINMTAIAFRESSWKSNERDNWVNDDLDLGGGILGLNLLIEPRKSRRTHNNFTKEDILDPYRAASFGYQMFVNSGYEPWRKSGGTGELAGTVWGGMVDLKYGHMGVQAAGLPSGDGSFALTEDRMDHYMPSNMPPNMASNMTPSMVSSGAIVHMPININLTGSGNVQRDAQRLAEYVKPAFATAWREVSSKRSN